MTISEQAKLELAKELKMQAIAQAQRILSMRQYWIDQVVKADELLTKLDNNEEKPLPPDAFKGTSIAADKFN